MCLLNVRKYGLCVKGLGVMETYDNYDAAMYALYKAQQDNMYSVDALYVKDFEKGTIYS